MIRRDITLNALPTTHEKKLETLRNSLIELSERMKL